MYVCWPGNRIRNLHFLFKLVFLRTAIMGPLPASLKLIARTGWFHLMTLISNVWWNANSIFPRKIDDNLMKVNACGAISVIIRTNPIQKGRLFPWKTKMDDCEMVFVIFFEFLFLIGFVPFEDVCLFLSRMKKKTVKRWIDRIGAWSRSSSSSFFRNLQCNHIRNEEMTPQKSTLLLANGFVHLGPAIREKKKKRRFFN